MVKDLVIRDTAELSREDKEDITKSLDDTIVHYQETAADISKLALNCLTAIASSTARGNALARQGFLSRHFSNLIGKNQRIQAEIDADRARVLYASQQMIQKLLKQNLLSFELLTVINNKLNALTEEFEQEIIDIYSNLREFIQGNKSDLIEIDQRIGQVEQDVRILKWLGIIKYLRYNGQDYPELPLCSKIVCLTNDFFLRTEGAWDIEDVLLLKLALCNIGIISRQKITINSFYSSLIDNDSLERRLFKGISVLDPEGIEAHEAPLIFGLNKINNFAKNKANESAGIEDERDSKDKKISSIQRYLADNAFIKTDVDINVFDFVLDLLVNLKLSTPKP